MLWERKGSLFLSDLECFRFAERTSPGEHPYSIENRDCRHSLHIHVSDPFNLYSATCRYA